MILFIFIVHSWHFEGAKKIKLLLVILNTLAQPACPSVIYTKLKKNDDDEDEHGNCDGGVIELSNTNQKYFFFTFMSYIFCMYTFYIVCVCVDWTHKCCCFAGWLAASVTSLNFILFLLLYFYYVFSTDPKSTFSRSMWNVHTHSSNLKWIHSE